ncbi:type 1 fimbrial major subunit FimA [Entomohabitans teleogrylli]|uniref:type 1 fimbrial major subunit FimA n=1 Tax=Entomohabitans teleogrylli TaxID=1384589 RepID=UPI00073DA1DA|nr:type 1 fimbrial major subunit FimA [Entomohabitans teleogrylli]
MEKLHQTFIKNVVAMALTVGISGVAIADSTVIGGTIYFEGEIVNTACSVQIPTSGQKVELGQYRAAALETNTYSSATPFTIQLDDCDTDVAEHASFAFKGIADADDSTVLAVNNSQGGTAATGVGIEIRDSSNTAMDITGATFGNKLALVDGTNYAQFTALYKATTGTVTAGRADSEALVYVQYE